jgi:16S rRNA (guanine1207-N2)-methyltransferase
LAKNTDVMGGPAAVMADVLRAEERAAPVLFAGESAGALATLFNGTSWSRSDAPWPPDGAFGAAVLDLPLTREAYRMAVHALAARLPSGAPLFVYGANKAGIKSADGVLAQCCEGIETVATRNHARIWRGQRNAASPMGHLSDWRAVSPIEIVGRRYEWVSYPGVFAQGRLDAGTALLLYHLPPVHGLKVLDFGAGTGVIARALLDRGAKVSLVEPDALSREAALENVPEAEILTGGIPPRRRYDLIVSNPPLHRGKEMDLSVVTRLIAEAPRHLQRDGALLIVTQKTIPVPRLAAPAAVQLRAEAGGYRVWQLAGAPKTV